MSNGGSTSGWIRRWWPVLAPASVSLACAAVFTLQQFELRDLKAVAPGPATVLPTAAPTAPQASESPGDASGASNQADEIKRLRARAAQLGAEVSQLEQMRAQNEDLRKQLATRSLAGLSTEEAKALEDARDRALSIQCVNNLKQLGLAVRMYATDNGDTTPANLQALTNYVGSFLRVFVCPGDSRHLAATDPASFSPANCSYDYLAPSVLDNEPNRVLFRCPIHGNIGLMDGSVQSRVAKEHPDWLVQQDGKLYMEAK